mmetsp:Transcript_12468/g.31920  ORF Transcript_12468/g.31920 Transcript_12468/m.31920 type:complete len:219 (+) Transcript_12468:307-963(+)
MAGAPPSSGTVRHERGSQPESLPNSGSGTLARCPRLNRTAATWPPRPSSQTRPSTVVGHGNCEVHLLPVGEPRLNGDVRGLDGVSDGIGPTGENSWLGLGLVRAHRGVFPLVAVRGLAEHVGVDFGPVPSEHLGEPRNRARPQPRHRVRPDPGGLPPLVDTLRPKVGRIRVAARFLVQIVQLLAVFVTPVRRERFDKFVVDNVAEKAEPVAEILGRRG